MGPSLEKEVNHKEGEGSQEGNSDQPGTKRPTLYLPNSHMEVGGCDVPTGQVISQSQVAMANSINHQQRKSSLDGSATAQPKPV